MQSSVVGEEKMDSPGPHTSSQYREKTVRKPPQRRFRRYPGPKAPPCFRKKSPPTGFIHMGWYGSGVNDPSAGSPTETLLRLLLPLNDKV